MIELKWDQLFQVSAGNSEYQVDYTLHFSRFGYNYYSVQSYVSKFENNELSIEQFIEAVLPYTTPSSGAASIALHISSKASATRLAP